MKKILFIIGVFSLIIVARPSSAFDNIGLLPPQPFGVFSTFNAETVGDNHYGIILSAERSIDTSFYRFTLSTEYGITDSSDVIVTIPFITGLQDTEGLDDISFGFKKRVVSGLKYGPNVSYVLAFSAPGKDAFSSEGHAGVGVLLSKRLGPFQGNLNMFYYKPTTASQEDLFETRIGFDLAAGHNFNILSEFLIRKGHDSESVGLIEGRFGYRVRLSSNSFSVVGLGYDFKNRDPEWRFFFSISMKFPVEKKEIKKIYEEE